MVFGPALAAGKKAMSSTKSLGKQLIALGALGVAAGAGGGAAAGVAGGELAAEGAMAANGLGKMAPTADFLKSAITSNPVSNWKSIKTAIQRDNSPSGNGARTARLAKLAQAGNLANALYRGDGLGSTAFGAAASALTPPASAPSAVNNDPRSNLGMDSLGLQRGYMGQGFKGDSSLPGDVSRKALNSATKTAMDNLREFNNSQYKASANSGMIPTSLKEQLPTDVTLPQFGGALMSLVSPSSIVTSQRDLPKGVEPISFATAEGIINKVAAGASDTAAGMLARSAQDEIKRDDDGVRWDQMIQGAIEKINNWSNKS